MSVYIPQPIETTPMIHANTKWDRPPFQLNLSPDEIDIWRAHLELPTPSVQRLQRILSPDEAARANSFIFEKDRLRFIIARGILRHILSQYLEVSPAQIQFRYNSMGKPELSTSSSLSFNLSHSDNVVLYAVGQNRKIGIDIEQIRNNVEFMQVAQSCFSSLECATLRSLPDHLVPQAFFNCWTRKEAYVKAIGAGFSFPLKDFDVSCIPGEPAALINIRSSQEEVSQWLMHEVFPGPKFAGALVVEASDLHPQFRQWSADVWPEDGNSE